VKVNNSTVSTQQTNTSNFKPPNTHREKYHDMYMAWKSRSWLETGTNMLLIYSSKIISMVTIKKATFEFIVSTSRLQLKFELTEHASYNGKCI